MRLIVGSRQQEGCNFLDSNEELEFHQVSFLMAREQSSLFVNLYLLHCIIFPFLEGWWLLPVGYHLLYL